MVFDYFDGGSGNARTRRENERVFEDALFRPRTGVFVPKPSLATSVLGRNISMPVILGPVGFLQLARHDAEPAVARAATRSEVGLCVSTLSQVPIARLTDPIHRPTWFQLYFAGGRAGAEVAIDAARSAGCDALVVTMDLPVEANALNGSQQRRSRPGLRAALANAPGSLIRPRWLSGFLRSGRFLHAANVRREEGAPLDVDGVRGSMWVQAPTWADFEWIRARWEGPIVAKGVLDPHSARRAVDAGADAVVVSNHGGYALDGTSSSLRALPPVVAAVGSDAEVLIDGGVRTGADVAKAVGLGARAVLLGRSYVWALAGSGEEGVVRQLESIRTEMNEVLALLGCRGVDTLRESAASIHNRSPDRRGDDPLPFVYWGP